MERSDGYPKNMALESAPVLFDMTGIYLTANQKKN